MALIVEDGSVVAGAQTYASATTVRAWCVARGLTLPESDTTLEQHILVAMDWLSAYADRWRGTRADEEQVLDWPRQNVQLYGIDFAEDEIPAQLVSALSRAAYDASQTDLLPTGTTQETISEKVGPVSTTYANAGSGTVRPVLTHVQTLLEPLLITGANAFTVLRV